MQKIWFDVEFNEYSTKLRNGTTIPVLDPISIGLVDEDDRTYSAVFKEFNKKAAKENRFLRDNVLSKLPPEKTWKSRHEIREDILNFIGAEDTQFRYWYAPQDAIILQNIFAPKFLQMPRNIQGFPYNLAQRFNDLGANRGIVPMKQNEHEALADAIWAKELDKAMDAYEFEMQPG